MEPLRITATDDCGIYSKYRDIIHRSSMLSIPLIRCDDIPVIKQENIDNLVLKGTVKEEMIEEIDRNNESGSFRIGYHDIIHRSSMSSIPLLRCEDIPVIKQENIDNLVFKGTVKEEMIEEIDRNNESGSFRIGSSMSSIPLLRCEDIPVIKQENIDNHVLNGTVKEEMIEEIDRNNESRSFQIGYELNLHHRLSNQIRIHSKIHSLPPLISATI
ncbi:unnamed protein product [Macrosiphum euphorbiae]|uniref:Uncharacterized protein n=1 Tax=Macrosiphum euphorbiae TaxID=13131 RepID=A0AAV0X1J7_9HEMI|nr:unnamed protein product [Macrosiphum euphorbiae]